MCEGNFPSKSVVRWRHLVFPSARSLLSTFRGVLPKKEQRCSVGSNSNPIYDDSSNRRRRQSDVSAEALPTWIVDWIIDFFLLAASDDDESAHRRISPALKILIAFPFAQHNRERFTHHVERELSSFRGWLDKGGRVLLSSLYFFA